MELFSVGSGYVCEVGPYILTTRNRSPTMQVLGNPAAPHAYEVEVTPGEYVKVYAVNRTQAASIAKRAGYTVRSVGMIG
jgi:hypothetical protein